MALVLTAHVPGRCADGPIENTLPFDMPSRDVLQRSSKKVFASYFLPFPISTNNKPPAEDYYTQQYLSPAGEGGRFRLAGGYLRERPLPRLPRSGPEWAQLDFEDEVRRASRIGLDGFVCDILSTSGLLWDRLVTLLDATERVDPDFDIVLMPDMDAVFGKRPDELQETIARLAARRAAYRLADGRLVVAPYNAQQQPASWWKQVALDLRGRGVDVALLPVFQGWQKYADSFAAFSYGISDWGPRWPSAAAELRSAPRLAHELKLIWMAPIVPQDMRPKRLRYWEAANTQLFRSMWEAAIEGGADWAHVITWNDYSESTEIAPSTGIQYLFYDLTAYYTVWFKLGRPPTIVRDVLYYAHRTHATPAPRDTTKQPEPFVLAGGDPARDEVELLAFLARPGTLEIELAGVTHRKDAPAGLTSFRVPLVPGRAVFRLVREGTQAIRLQSAWPIVERVEYQDMLYRGGSSSRPAVAQTWP